MMPIVSFRFAKSNWHQTGAHSYDYKGSVQIIVQNLAYDKQVSMWAKVGGKWQDIFARFVESLPGNLELWVTDATCNENDFVEFVAKYTVKGVTYWDNNAGRNYQFPREAGESGFASGLQYPVVLSSASLSNLGGIPISGMLNVTAAVQNLALNKVVGIVYTTNNWGLVGTAYGSYYRTLGSGLELWRIQAPVQDPSGGHYMEGRFAIFYRVLGNEYWDNNFSRNYFVPQY